MFLKYVYVLVDRMINILVGDRFNRNNEIHLTLTLYYTPVSRLSNSRLGIFPITLVFSSPCSRSTGLAYISLIRSFFYHEISQTLRSHHTTLILSLSPHSSFHTNIMYFHSSMVTTTTLCWSNPIYINLLIKHSMRRDGFLDILDILEYWHFFNNSEICSLAPACMR